MPDDYGDDYAVGYRRPPKHTRFKKGQSGNRSGRPKSKGAEATDVAAILDEPVQARIGGKVRKMQAFEASLRQLAKRALAGDIRAIIRFIKFCEQYGVVKPPPAVSGGGVIVAPKGVDLHEWLDSVTDVVPIDEA